MSMQTCCTTVLHRDAKYAESSKVWSCGREVFARKMPCGVGIQGMFFISYSLQIAILPLTQRGRASCFCIFNHVSIFCVWWVTMPPPTSFPFQRNTIRARPFLFQHNATRRFQPNIHIRICSAWPSHAVSSLQPMLQHPLAKWCPLILEKGTWLGHLLQPSWNQLALHCHPL